MKDKLRKERSTFAGQPEICWICARSIIAIRRAKNVERHWGTLRYLMETKNIRDVLLPHLPTKWLKSICDTYADHGTADEQAAAMCLVLLVNLTRMAETERFLSSDASVDENQLNKVIHGCSVQLWDGLNTFYVDTGNMPRLMFGRIEKILSPHAPLLALYETIIQRMLESGGNMIARLEKMNPRFWPE
ncbi:MAG: hypothetical protein K8R87_04090 [Verrucomicrobia bacterium]|nr:hypothetical protein [Verrucomicrobiota bacterium]